jgi:hypothetical protein
MIDISDRVLLLESRTANLEALLTEQALTLAIQFERIAQLQAQIDLMIAESVRRTELIDDPNEQAL